MWDQWGKRLRGLLAVGADIWTWAVGVGLVVSAVIGLWLQASRAAPQPWLAVIVVGVFLAVAGVSGRLWQVYRPRDRQTEGLGAAQLPTPPLAHPLAQRLRAVSGETLMREVLTARPNPGQQYEAFGKYIPAHGLADFKLGEVALLRRMTTRLEMSENLSRRECENILTVSGITDPNHSLIRLEQHHLIRSEDGDVAVIVESPPGYSGGGGLLASDFTKCLVRDPLLVAAYRKVSLAIDKVIRAEPMEFLVGDEVSYEAWMASVSL